ncbi:amidohydrolase [bacterium]|nr:amidohydrolase [bacterium]
MARTIFTGAKVHRHDRAWGDADDELLLENGQVVATARGDEISSAAAAADEIVRLPGGRILPGFFDAHLHVDQGGRLLASLQLLDKSTKREVLESVAEAAKSGDGWLIGIGLSEHAWPTLAERDQVCPNRPLLLHARDYHTVLINSRAIEQIGLTNETPLPEGGWQELDEAGFPRGILCENAARWIEQFLPEETPEQLRGLMRKAMRHLLSLGITGVSDAGDPASYDNGWLWLEENEGLPLHVESWLRCVHFGDDCIAQPRRMQGKLNRFRLKLFIDGALGSRTAWMKHEYADKPGHTSGPVPDLAVYDAFLKRGADAGWSFTVHAIGDAGVDYVAESLAQLPARTGRHRIEHIQHVDAVSMQRMLESDLALSVQPTHRLDDLGMLRDRVGEREKWAYPLKSLSVADRLVLGSDWPVVDPDPRRTIRAALLPRKPGEGMPDQHLTASEAVLALTRNAARVAGFPNLGSLEPGYTADMVWLDRDPGDDPDAWPEAKVGAVWTGGTRVKRDNDLI